MCWVFLRSWWWGGRWWGWRVGRGWRWGWILGFSLWICCMLWLVWWCWIRWLGWWLRCLRRGWGNSLDGVMMFYKGGWGFIMMYCIICICMIYVSISIMVVWGIRYKGIEDIEEEYRWYLGLIIINLFNFFLYICYC